MPLVFSRLYFLLFCSKFRYNFLPNQTLLTTSRQVVFTFQRNHASLMCFSCILISSHPGFGARPIYPRKTRYHQPFPGASFLRSLDLTGKFINPTSEKRRSLILAFRKKPVLNVFSAENWRGHGYPAHLGAIKIRPILAASCAWKCLEHSQASNSIQLMHWLHKHPEPAVYSICSIQLMRWLYKLSSAPGVIKLRPVLAASCAWQCLDESSLI